MIEMYKIDYELYGMHQDGTIGNVIQKYGMAYSDLEFDQLHAALITYHKDKKFYPKIRNVTRMETHHHVLSADEKMQGE